MHMLPSFLPVCAALGLLEMAGNGGLIGLVTISLAMAIPIIGIITAYSHKRRQEELWHETARLALEKGQPIPARPPADEDTRAQVLPAAADPATWDQLRNANRRRKDVRNGLILVAIGVALNFTRKEDHFGRGLSFLIYIPIFMGLALLLNALLDRIFFHRIGDLPPRS